jgi:hypothetical protein
VPAAFKDSSLKKAMAQKAKLKAFAARFADPRLVCLTNGTKCATLEAETSIPSVNLVLAEIVLLLLEIGTGKKFPKPKPQPSPGAQRPKKPVTRNPACSAGSSPHGLRPRPRRDKRRQKGGGWGGSDVGRCVHNKYVSGVFGLAMQRNAQKRDKGSPKKHDIDIRFSVLFSQKSFIFLAIVALVGEALNFKDMIPPYFLSIINFSSIVL